MKRSIRIGMLVLVAMGVGTAIFVYKTKNSHSTHDRAFSFEQGGRSTPAEQQLPKEATAGKSTQPKELPRRDIREYQKLADHGDANAACIVAVKFAACERISIRDRETLTKIREVASLQSIESKDKKLKELADREEMSISDMRMCAEIGDSDTSRAWHYMVQSADAGNVPLMMEFVTRPPLDPRNMMDDPDGWKAYQEKLPRYLESAISKGNKPALIMAYGLFSGQDTVMGMSSTERYRNDFKALVYGEAIMNLSPDRAGKLVSRSVSDLRKRIGAEKTAKAQSLAVDITQQFDRENSGWMGGASSNDMELAACTSTP